jgi:hypothetical protein
MLSHTDYFTENLEESPQQKHRFVFQDVYFYGYVNFSTREVLNIINHKNIPKTYSIFIVLRGIEYFCLKTPSSDISLNILYNKK